MLQRRLVSSAAAARLSSAEVRSQCSSLFSQEQTRQRALYPRTEKIEVTLQGPGLQGSLLIMNKGVSTPHSCTRHLSEWHVKSSAFALVDGQPWHMHRPLTSSCDLTLLTFKDEAPQIVNQAYWRSCAALLGQVLDGAFKDEYSVELLKIPEVPVITGAFCCDVVLDPRLDSWTPSEENLRSLTREALQLIQKDLPWEPLEVSPSVALEIFSHSRYKQEQVEESAAQSQNGKVSLYRCGHHVMLSDGPLVTRTGMCSQYEVTAVHTLGERAWGVQRRAQGLSLPVNLTAHHTIWRKLRQRAERLVEITTSSTETPLLTHEATPPSSSPQQ
ncbi:39S ribosomal protein L39, mitochondrial [Triplophysa tibetana]|uniref:Large ribosomal subunit protein mL39 n=1 Tax=Triplophysa tibetana TaxID=1572043 RepID=A0A5A9PPE1_9TELE|nr:39S ribosomal protein L39, mitochondrial [Triplophysa tibetana]KAA0722738.1 39S ribosomal protein L39, mitochondrial [Triplophysa tibetana]